MSWNLPLKLLFETKPLIINIETKSGEKYRGKLLGVDDNMNCYLENVSFQKRNGPMKKNFKIFLRGNNIKMIFFPDILKEAPLIK